MSSKSEYQGLIETLQMIEQIKEDVDSGLSMVAVAEKYEIPYHKVLYTVNSYDERKEKLTERIAYLDKIHDYVQKGYTSVEIAKLENCSRQNIDKYAYQRYNKHIKDILMQQELETIKKYQNKTLEEIMALTDLKESKIRKLAEQLNITIETEFQRKTRLRTEKMIALSEKGLTNREIAKKMNIPSGSVTQHLVKSGVKKRYVGKELFDYKVRLVTDYFNGVAVNTIIEKYECSRTTVYNALNLSKNLNVFIEVVGRLLANPLEPTQKALLSRKLYSASPSLVEEIKKIYPTIVQQTQISC